jgi:hypothetical protein
MSCADVARGFAFLANNGYCPNSGEQVLSARQAQQVNAIMATSGLYDEAGNFAYRVGLPGKSGVGGGIVAVVPGRYSIVRVVAGAQRRGQFAGGVAGAGVVERADYRVGVFGGSLSSLGCRPERVQLGANHRWAQQWNRRCVVITPSGLSKNIVVMVFIEASTHAVTIKEFA